MHRKHVGKLLGVRVIGNAVVLGSQKLLLAAAPNRFGVPRTTRIAPKQELGR
ncbi:MAG: hypothetical protein WAK31_30865 [Chthoniobacterales bacterium]